MLQNEMTSAKSVAIQPKTGQLLRVRQINTSNSSKRFLSGGEPSGPARRSPPATSPASSPSWPV